MENRRRHTKQLNVIWEAIKDDTSHPTADLIFEKVRAVIPNISLGTVYRNLQKLVAEKRLQVLTVGRTQRFDPMVKRHGHFVCERCGRLYDIQANPRNEVFASSVPPEGFTVTSHQLSVYGVCDQCSS
jgi:Fe2+ or Zn2+ uptake regulation protein